MHKIDQRTIACAILTMVLLGPLTARFESVRAQGFTGTRLAQAMTARQKLRDALLDKTPSVRLGRTRGIVLGAPVRDDSRQKRRVQDIIRKNTTRAPALPGPRLSGSGQRTQGSSNGAEPVALSQKMSKADREDLKKIADDNKLPAVDLEIYFRYNSAEINPRSIPDLVLLGQVLIDPKLKGSTFMVAGYTDAKGGNRYNQSLSERRARTVQVFLRRTFNIAAQRLLPVGYGEEHLKNSSNPFAAENRRVQIVNLSAIK
ncbi:MAG: OmpA family protein [Hyphomicrobiaceae bacterium]|nr:OmpA family protein [Hyphomicrobiaceae bacterium]